MSGGEPAEPVTDACGCDAFATIFDRRTAARDRERYRREGPDRTTRLLLELLAPYRSSGVSVLDIGGGIGIVDVELLRAGAGRAVLVDASTAYLEAARQQAREAGMLDRIEFVEGDFVRRAGAIEGADIVTLDRVVCCYRDMEALVGLSSERARTAYGLVLPRDRWITRLAIAVVNVGYRLRRRAYRAYVHPTTRVDEIAASNGLRARAERQTWSWRVVVYDRVMAGAGA
jgi:magnesium-protoporphyrin O-methyltransferase